MNEILRFIFESSLCLIPGFIVQFIVEQGTVYGRKTESQTKMSWLFYSALIYPFALSKSECIISIFEKNIFLGYVILFLVVMIPSIILGFLLCIIIRKEGIYRALRAFHFPTKAPYPSAWDFRFSKETSQYLIVHLKNNNIIRGLFWSSSFASGDVENQDLFLEEICNEDWDPVEETAGIWINSDEIAYIIFKSTDNN